MCSKDEERRTQLILKTYQHLILAFWGTKQTKNQNV